MKLALDSKLTQSLFTCSKEVFRTLLDLNEKGNAEFGSTPFTRLAFEQMLVAMSVYLAEMFPESHIPAITGTYCMDTGTVDLPNLLPVIEKLVADNQGLRPVKQKDTTMQDSTPFTAQTFSKAATEEMQPRTPHPSETVEAIMRKIESSPVLTEIEKEILFAHIQDGSQYAAPLPLSISKDDDGTCGVSVIKEADDTLSVVIGDRKWPLNWEGMIGDSPDDALNFDHAVSELGLLQRSYYTRVRRDADDAPCPIQITQEKDRTFSVVINGKRWPIGSYGTIGHTVQDGEDFQKALLLHGSVAHAGGPYVVRIPSTEEIWSDKVSTKEHQQRLCRLSREFEHAMKARGGVGKSLGQIAYEGFNDRMSSPIYDAIPQEEKMKWERAGTRAFTWLSLVPEEIEKEIQIIAGRKRLLILSQTETWPNSLEQRQADATLLNSLAGFPRAPELKS